MGGWGKLICAHFTHNLKQPQLSVILVDFSELEMFMHHMLASRKEMLS